MFYFCELTMAFGRLVAHLVFAKAESRCTTGALEGGAAGLLEGVRKLQHSPFAKRRAKDL